MTVFFATFMATAVWGLLLGGGNRALCILLLAAAVAGGVFRILAKGKLRSLSLCFIPICLILCAFTGQSEAEGGPADYRDRISDIAARIEREDQDKAVELLDEADEKFGATDLSRCLRAEIYLSLGQYETALNCLSGSEKKGNAYLYDCMERIYALQRTEDAGEMLKSLYLEAADALPGDAHMQYMAGLVKLGEGARESAAYRFERARLLDEEDALSCYYLGVIRYEQGRTEEAAEYFEEALQRGADDEKREYIRWYTEQSGGREESDE